MAFNPANAVDPTATKSRWLDPAEAPAEKEKESGLQDFGEGIGSSLINTFYGIKGLGTDLTDKEKARMADWEADAAESGWGTAGRVVGEIGQLALPGAGAVKGLRLAGKAAQAAGAVKKGQALIKAAPVLADAGTSAGLGFLKAPEEGFTRGQGAQQELIASLLGSGAGKVLSKAVRGVKRTDIADKLMNQGVYLTPGQAASGDFVQGLEKLGEYFPIAGISRGTRKAQQRAKDSWAEKVFDIASPKGKKITAKGYEGVLELKGEFNKAYDDAWAGATELPSQSMVQMLTDISKRMGISDGTDASTLDKLRRDIVRVAGNPNPAKAAREVDTVLRKAIRKAADSKGSDLADPIKDFRDIYRGGFANNVKEDLAAVDKFYPSFLTVRKAAASAEGTGGVFTAGQLTNASRSVGKEIKASEGASPLYDMAFGGQSAIGQTGSSQELLGTFRKMMQLSPTMIPMQYMGRNMTGETVKQRGAQAVIDSPIAKMLRSADLVGSGRVGAAYED